MRGAFTLWVVAVGVSILLAGAVGRSAQASGGSVTNVTEQHGGTVIHVGNTWNVWAPSNFSTGTTGGVNVYTDNGDWVSVGGDAVLPSGSLHTPQYTSGSTLIVCPPGSANSNAIGCHTNGNVGIDKTSTNDPELGMVSINGNFFPNFCWCQTTGYEYTVSGPTSSLTFSAIPVDSNGATYKVNGNAGQQSVSLNPKGSDTLVAVTGVANNPAATQNYTFTVHRGLANADLSNLTISPGSITGFSSSTTSYSTSVPKATTEVAVTPTLSDANGSYAVDVDGTPVADPAHTPINATDSTIHVVTSSDSTLTHKTYSIAVHRGIANADLSDLTISPGSISGFSPSTTSYSTKVPSTATEVAVASTTADANASTAVDVGGTPVADPAHTPLAANDPSTIHVVVTADDTTTMKTYTITVGHLLSEGLHVVFAGNGKGTVTSSEPDTTINCTAPSTGTCLANYDEGTGVTLAEAPATGSFFNGWSGDCGTGSDTTISFTMPSAAAACTATFTSLGAKQSGTAPKVNTQNDDASSSDHNCYAGRCTLRDALASVTNNGTITFAGGVTNLHLDEGLGFDAAGKTASIAGTGVTVDGSDVGGDPTLNLVNGTLKITGLTIAHNSDGGGLANQSGTLNLTNVVVNDNGAFLGGGIATSGTTTMTGGEISENGSFACAGIYLQAGTTTLTNVSVVSNESEVAGGGACVSSGSTLNITGGEVSGNEVCGFCGGGGGGGIDVDGGTLNASGTQIDGNNATSGAGVLVETGDGPGIATLTNVTLFNNQGDWALTADSPNVAKLINSTVVGNQGGVRSGDGTAVLLNTLLAGNGGQDCDPPNNPSSLGHNVSDDSSCSSLVATGDQANVAAHLGDEENGVVPLDNGSPALNSGATGTVSGLTVPTKDALGTTRPQGSGVDVGALEMTFHKLTIKTAGPGKGTVDPPSGSYVAGSSVHLTATPDVGSGSAFVGWSGACAGTDVGTDVVMSADETCTATFAAPPHVNAFAPSSGRIRSTITLTGTGFTGVTSVTVGGHDAAFKVTGDTKIAVTVPDDANTGDNLITVTGPADHSTVGPWKLTWPAPKITAFTPAKAGGGQTVSVTGTGFLGAFAADFDGQDVTPTVVSDTKITLVVPATPDSTGLIHITTPGDTATSKTPFTFIPLPVVDDPSSAAIGATILITGANFTGATAVTMGGVAAKFKVVNGASIQLVVPDNLTDGPIAVTTPGGTGASAGNFVHSFIKPVITSFTPVKGPIRSTVTLTGSHFRGSTELSFAGHDATDWTIVSDTKITAKVPDSAETGKIALTNPADTGLSSVNFTVSWVKPTISSFTPLTGPTGTTVTINGTGFLGTTSVKFGGVAATDITVVSATKITVVVPDGATTGKVTVTTPGGTATSAKNYTVT